MVLAHRYNWTLERGTIPEGLDVCHTCDNPPCVRPSHLFLGTHADNMRDMLAKGRRRGFSGAANPAAKLSDAEAREIRELWQWGASGTALARRFGLTYEMVWKIGKGKAWKHVG